MAQSLLPNIPEICKRLRNADRILLALDFDGTLAPIANRPEDASIPWETLGLLRTLAASERVSVVILSGRSISDLKSKANLDCIYSGNHGLEIEGRGLSFIHKGAQGLRNAVNTACGDLEAAFEGVRGVFVECKGLTATVHFRQAPAELSAWIEATVRLAMQPYATVLRLRPALKSFEVHPGVNWHKGSALKFTRNRIRPEPLVICAGDDETDEDMFRVSPDAVSIKVGRNGRTDARYEVDCPGQLATFLGTLRSVLRSDADSIRLQPQTAGVEANGPSRKSAAPTVPLMARSSLHHRRRG